MVPLLYRWWWSKKFRQWAPPIQLLQSQFFAIASPRIWEGNFVVGNHSFHRVIFCLVINTLWVCIGRDFNRWWISLRNAVKSHNIIEHFWNIPEFFFTPSFRVFRERDTWVIFHTSRTGNRRRESLGWWPACPVTFARAGMTGQTLLIMPLWKFLAIPVNNGKRDVFYPDSFRCYDGLIASDVML